MDTIIASPDRELRLALDLTLRLEPGFRVVTVTGSSRALLGAVSERHHEVIIVDSGFSRPTALGRELRSRAPDAHIVVLDRADGPGLAEADEVVMVEAGPDALLRSLRSWRGRLHEM